MSAKSVITAPRPRRAVSRVEPTKPDPIREMRAEMFMLAYRMSATVNDALVAQKSKLWELATGHLEEMARILENTKNKYR